MVYGHADTCAHTAYVGDSEGFPFTISVIRTSTCNGTQTAGCGQSPAATVPIAGNPYGLALNQATGTLYATNMSTPCAPEPHAVAECGRHSGGRRALSRLCRSAAVMGLAVPALERVIWARLAGAADWVTCR